ncbi:MAG: HAMP domain-containing protein [Acidimicrobiia bacterium]|nr:HAMP domain-containing protein [Acidimicrobiia bacterium]
MRFSLKQQQVFGVTVMVALIVSALSLLHLVNTAGVLLAESRDRFELFGSAVYSQTAAAIATPETAYQDVRTSRFVQSALESALYSQDTLDASIVDPAGIVVASSDPAQIGRAVARRPQLNDLMAMSGLARLRAIYAANNNIEWTQPMALGDRPFGEIRIGLTTALVQRDLNESLRPSALAASIALLIAVVTSLLLAQLVLRPMHIIRSSLSRLGRGDLGATLDLRDDDEFRELGDVFDQVSAQLRAASPAGLTRAQLAELSRRIAMVGRLTAGVAHEMKNPLNAMTIHLELLKQKLAQGKPASMHADVIEQEIRRLDERIQGFLRFVRPDEVKFGAVALAPLLGSVLDAVQLEAQRANVSIARHCGDGALLVEGDAAQLRDVFLNLAQNAIQAMPKGGRLTVSCAALPDRRVRVRVEDTGVGIAPENLTRIFELYYTTKERGTGVGLSMVYRTVQIHNGEIDVESTVGVGTTFIVVLPAVRQEVSSEQ